MSGGDRATFQHGVNLRLTTSQELLFHCELILCNASAGCFRNTSYDLRTGTRGRVLSRPYTHSDRDRIAGRRFQYFTEDMTDSESVAPLNYLQGIIASVQADKRLTLLTKQKKKCNVCECNAFTTAELEDNQPH